MLLNTPSECIIGKFGDIGQCAFGNLCQAVFVVIFVFIVFAVLDEIARLVVSDLRAQIP